VRGRLRLSLLAAALALAGCSLAEDVTPPPGLPEGGPVQPAFVDEPTASAPDTTPDLASGADLFADHCVACHGPGGLGDGPQSGNLPVPPAPLGNAALARAASLAGWYQMVTTGNLDRFMPGFQSLTDQERWDVAAYALTLSSSTDEVEQGQEIYEANSCGECHTPGGAASALTAVDLAERSGDELFQAISEGSPDGEMPAFAGTLSEAERWALVAYLRRAGGAPAASPPTPAPEPTLENANTPESAAATTAIPTAGPTATQNVVAGAIRGQVTNGTEGGAVPADLEVTLHGLEGADEVLSQATTVEGDGSFAFEGLEIVPGRLFNVTVDYRGVSYESEMAHLVEGSSALELPLTVYETTADLAGLRVAQLHLIVSSPLDGFVRGLEVWVFSNPGDHAILPAEGDSLLEVVLPEGAVPVQTSGAELIGPSSSASNGYRYTLGVPPGVASAQLAVIFDVPFNERLDLVQPVPYPMESVVLLTEAGGLVPRGAGWQDLGAADFSGVSVEQFAGEAPAAGETMRLTLVPGSGGSAPGSTLVGLGIGVGVLGAAVIVTGLWWYRRRAPSPARAGHPVQGEARDESILRAMAALDDEFEAGKLDAQEYRSRRQALKQRALDRARGGRD
jgi:mono/diheme cytochrome c family protein